MRTTQSRRSPLRARAALHGLLAGERCKSGVLRFADIRTPGPLLASVVVFDGLIVTSWNSGNVREPTAAMYQRVCVLARSFFLSAIVLLFLVLCVCAMYAWVSSCSPVSTPNSRSPTFDFPACRVFAPGCFACLDIGAYIIIVIVPRRPHANQGGRRHKSLVRPIEVSILTGLYLHFRMMVNT